MWFCDSIMNAVKVSLFRTPPALLGFQMPGTDTRHAPMI